MPRPQRGYNPRIPRGSYFLRTGDVGRWGLYRAHQLDPIQSASIAPLKISDRHWFVFIWWQYGRSVQFSHGLCVQSLHVAWFWIMVVGDVIFVTIVYEIYIAPDIVGLYL